MQGINEEYGGTYSVKDTDGNTVTLSDVASATKLQSIDNTKIGDLQYSGVTGTEVTNNDSLTTAVGKLDNAVEEATTEAGKHASVSVGDNLSVDSSKTNTNGGIDYHVTLDDTLYLGGEHTAENSKITLDGETGTAIIGNSTNGKATIGGVNITTTTTGESTSSTVTGLTNTTLGDDAPNSTFAKVGRAATEEQLQKAMTKIDEASYKGWNVTTNKGTKTAEVASDGNVDFSNNDKNIIVGQDGTNLTFDLNDNITLGDESGTRIQLNGNPQKDSMISITNKDSDTVFNIAKDGTVHSDGDIVAKADSNKKYSLSEVGEYAVRYNNEDKSTVALAGTSGTTITNVADGALNEKSTEAVNGSQLYAVDQKVNDGWTAKVGNDEINVRPNGENETGKDTLSFAGDDNITVTADAENNAISVGLNDNITLGEGDSQIHLNGAPKEGEVLVAIGSGENPKFMIGQNGEITANAGDTSFNLSSDGVAVNANGTSTIMNGQSVIVGSDVNGEGGVVINNNGSGTINGLSNTKWDKDNFVSGQAATEDQLQVVATEAAKHTTVSGDDNLTVNKTQNPDGSNNYQVTLNDNITLGEGDSQIHLNGAPKEGEVLVAIGSGENPKFMIGQNGEITANAGDTSFNLSSDGVAVNANGTSTIMNGQSVIVGSDVNGEGGVVINNNGSGTINGLSNTKWDKDNFVSGQAATEDQLQQATAASKTTLSDGVNTTVTFNDNTPDGHVDYQVNLNDNVYLGGNNKPGSSNIELDGENGTIQVGSNIILDSKEARAVIGGVDISTTFDDIGKKSSTITGLSNTTWDTDKVVIDRAATEGQLQMVSDKVIAGWTATDDAGNKINVNPDNHPTLNFASGKNITVSAVNDEVEVSLNDNINLNDRVYINGDPEEGNNTIVDIKSGNTSKEESIFAVEDKGNGSISIGGIDITNVDGPYLAVGDGKLKFYKDGGLSTGNATGTFSVRPDGDLEISGKNSSFNVDAETGNVNAINSSGSAIMMNDDSIALNASGNGVAISDEGILLNTNGIDEDIKLVTKGTTVSVDKDGTTFTNVNTNETTNIDGGTINVGDRLMVEDDGSIYATNNNGSTVMINDNGVALNSEGNGVVVSGEGITLNTNGSAVTVDRFNGTTFTNTNTGEFTNINGGTITTNTVKGLDNTTWSEDLAEEVANSEELQSTAATQGQLQQAVSEVAEVANAGWNAKAGGNTINVKPNETLNFEGDGNITVSATGGTSNELKFGLNDNITLGDKAGQKTSTSLTLYTDPTLKEVTKIGEDGNPETVKVTGYIPESYIDDQERVDNFISTHGGFMMYATNTSGEGVFGITTDGMVHAKDVISYMPNSDSTSKDKILKYSLNDIGDIVTQIAHGQYDKTGMEYTLISDFSSEADKDKPFQSEEKERTIGLAVREDGAVVVGAVVDKSGNLDDSGIRINAEKRVNKDGTTSSDNMATITGLENTEWKPPTPVATLAANDGTTTTETSRAATEAQLDDLYSSVVGYNVEDGSIDHTHVTLGGKKTYGLGRAIGDHSGGVVLDNVAYASGTDGSEAVNVDYLNDAINNAVKDGGAMSTSEKHLATNSGTKPDGNATYAPDADGNITISEVNGDGDATGNSLVISDVASKSDVGDLNYSNAVGTEIADGDTVTDAIGKLDNRIDSITDTATNADKATVTGGNIKDDGTISLTQKDGTTIDLDGKLADSGVVQEGTSFDKETGTLTITSQDKYSGETSSVKVEGIASTEVVGATTKEDLATAYKDADKDGNATTEYITDSESMVEADVALDHAIQDVAGTSYANDMVLSNRIDSVEKRLGNVEERIDKVGAMAAAIANLRTMGFDPEAPTEIAIGVGQYKSETGIAIGVFHYPNQDFMLSASLSSSGDELMGGIGATWKLGRKSAAERAKDEEARHLEQAEEMKKLAQQEKVKAQAQRHAKLLAERQQASQKNA